MCYLLYFQGQSPCLIPGKDGLQRNWVRNIRWSWMKPNIAFLEVISWSSLAWGNMKWKVRNAWISKGTQSAQVLMELAGVSNLESWSFGTWFRLTACGYSCDWRIGPLVRGKGCECLEFCSLTKPGCFEYTECHGRGYTSVLGSMMISKKHSLESWTKWVKTQYRHYHRDWGPAPGITNVTEGLTWPPFILRDLIQWESLQNVLCLPKSPEIMAYIKASPFAVVITCFPVEEIIVSILEVSPTNSIQQ